MDNDELLKFCNDNKFFVGLLRSQVTDKRVAKDFADFTSIYEEGQTRFAQKKENILSNLKVKKQSLSSNIESLENTMLKTKKEIENIDEESAKIETL